jgi:hypothetical protein
VLTSCHSNMFGFGALPSIMANSTRELLWRYHWEVLDHPPYSPDLAPSDFHLFGPLKDHLGGRRFTTDGEVHQAIMSWLQALMLRQVWGLCGKIISTRAVLLIIHVYII